jgi:outer membrane usher protein
LLGYRYSTKGFYTLDDVAWRSMEGYQYGDSQDNDGVPDVQSYHNLTWNKKGASSSISPSRWGITDRCMSLAASKATGEPANQTSGISLATRAAFRASAIPSPGRGIKPWGSTAQTGSPRLTSPFLSACSRATVIDVITPLTGLMPRHQPAGITTVTAAGKPGSAARYLKTVT